MFIFFALHHFSIAFPLLTNIAAQSYGASFSLRHSTRSLIWRMVHMTQMGIAVLLELLDVIAVGLLYSSEHCKMKPWTLKIHLDLWWFPCWMSYGHTSVNESNLLQSFLLCLWNPLHNAVLLLLWFRCKKNEIWHRNDRKIGHWIYLGERKQYDWIKREAQNGDTYATCTDTHTHTLTRAEKKNKTWKVLSMFIHLIFAM